MTVQVQLLPDTLRARTASGDAAGFSSRPGGIRTHSISPSQGEWSAVAYRAMLRVVKDHASPVPGVGVEPTRAGSKPASLPLADPGVFQESGVRSQESGVRSRLSADP